MSIKNDIQTLKEQDIYSLMLFCLYKISSIPEYSSISELIYVLDKPNFLNLCEYFGGQTIKIPTINELYSLVYALLLYQYVQIDKIPYDEALQLIGHKSKELRAVKHNYKVLCDVMSNYNIVSRKNV